MLSSQTLKCLYSLPLLSPISWWPTITTTSCLLSLSLPRTHMQIFSWHDEAEWQKQSNKSHTSQPSVFFVWVSVVSPPPLLSTCVALSPPCLTRTGAFSSTTGRGVFFFCFSPLCVWMWVYWLKECNPLLLLLLLLSTHPSPLCFIAPLLQMAIVIMCSKCHNW